MQNRKIRIAHIITDLTSSGSSSMLYKLMAHTDRSRFDPVIIALDSEGEFIDKIIAHAIPVYTFNMSRNPSSSWHVLRLARLLRKLEPDILQGWMYQGNLAASLASKLLAKRPVLLWNVRQTVYNLQQEPRSTRWAIGFSQRLMNMPDRILYNSWLSENQHAALGFDEQKSQIVANGFDLQLFAPNTYSRELMRTKLAIPQDAIVIGMVAHYCPSKNHALFMEAAHLLGMHNRNVHFILAGEQVSTDNPEIAALLKRFPTLQGKLHLLGKRQDIPALMNALDMFTLTATRGDGFPNAVGEAMACGVPCIATDIGDTALLINKTGQTLQEATPSSLAFAWQEWINAGEIWRKEQGRQARKRIQKHYAIQNIASQYQDIYQSLDQKRLGDTNASTEALKHAN